MHQAIDSLLKTRTWALQLVEELSNEALNTIPERFNNNIIWNLAHLVAAEQGVCYVRSGGEPVLPADFVKKYTRGTRPEAPVTAKEIAEIKALLLSTLPRLDADLAAGRFAGYKAWTTPYGVELQTIEDALQFLRFHEGMHCGYIMALKRVERRSSRLRLRWHRLRTHRSITASFAYAKPHEGIVAAVSRSARPRQSHVSGIQGPVMLHRRKVRRK